MSQDVKVLTHKAKFVPNTEDFHQHDSGDYWFVRVLNVGDKPAEITHLWIVTEDGELHLLDSHLPCRLESESSFVTCVSADHLAKVENPAVAFRVFTSRGNTFTSETNTVPAKGNV